MRRLVVSIALLPALVATATAGARDPRLEQLRLNKADNALARSIGVTQREAGSGFRKLRLPESDRQTSCPGFRPNLSRFTITGKATTAFAHASGMSIVSAVEVYESRADAAGDFRAAATPALARCLRHELERDFEASSLLASVRSAKVVPMPRLAERRIAYRIVAGVETGGLRNVTFVVDVVVLQRGRSIAALLFTGVNKAFPRRDRVAAAVASRMR